MEYALNKIKPKRLCLIIWRANAIMIMNDNTPDFAENGAYDNLRLECGCCGRSFSGSCKWVGHSQQ